MKFRKFCRIAHEWINVETKQAAGQAGALLVVRSDNKARPVYAEDVPAVMMPELCSIMRRRDLDALDVFTAKLPEPANDDMMMEMHLLTKAAGF